MTTWFNNDQIKALEVIFGIKRVPYTTPVRDGWITKGDRVWWRHLDGPESVNSAEHWANILEYPELYQIARPCFHIEYID